MKKQKPLLAYFGHHKCASTWITLINRAVCRELNLKFRIVDSPRFNPAVFAQGLNAFVKRKRIDFLSYINADFQFAKGLENCAGFHVIRDPRDIVVSAYFSHLYSHPTAGWPELAAHRAQLQKVGKEEGLLLEMKFRMQEFEALYNWNYHQDNVLEMKMEDMIGSPYETMVQALSFLGLVDTAPTFTRRFIHAVASAAAIHIKGTRLIPVTMAGRKIPVDNLLGYIFKNRFSSIARGRTNGEEDVKSHYRKGVAGDWVNHFSPDHCRVFNEMFDDLLVKLGYETSTDWQFERCRDA